MRFWRLVTLLWPFRSENTDRDRARRRLPSPVVLSEPDRCEDRTARSALYDFGVESDGAPAEVFYVPVQQQARQADSTQSRFRRLSAIIVDYLLEYEWFYLLTGYRSSQTESSRLELEATPCTERTESPTPQSDLGSTTCVSESAWSVSSTFISPPDPPTNEAD
jgi:hypothetical protein